MANCGIGACARDGSACTSKIIEMIFEVITGVITGIVFIASFGTASGGVLALK